MNNRTILFQLVILFLLTSCLEQKAAIVEYKGDQFYGFNDMIVPESSKQEIVTKSAFHAKKNKNKISSSSEVTVQEGDSLQTIADSYDVPEKYLAEENQLIEPYLLDIGQKIKIPPVIYHEVKLDETLESIARIYAQSPEEIAALNSLEKPYDLDVGQVVKIIRKKIVKQHQDLDDEMKELEQEIAKRNINVDEKSPENKDENNIENSKDNSIDQSQEIKPVILHEEESFISKPKFTMPVSGKIISSFDVQEGVVNHDGIKIAAKLGDPVKAARAGKIVYAGDQVNKYGNLVIIKHQDNFISGYGHLSEMSVNVGDYVKAGDVIGKVGMTGLKIKEPQLYFAIKQGKTPVDPDIYLIGQ